MEKRIHRIYSADNRPTTSELVKAVEQKAYLDARTPLDTEESILLFLRSWWSRTYNRPLKDPILLSYSFEELLYEFFDKIERKKAAEEATNKESDKIEEKKEEDFNKWAEEEERRELEEQERLAREAESALNNPDSEDNEQWMEEQLRLQKEKYGEDFGEDINFNGDA
jgi:hypothetical protein